jgi:ParB family chromosome partitioning protein
VSEVRVDEIIVTGRHRKELGDLDALASSIKSIGLLHPPVVTPDNRLVAGQRRLEACRMLGMTEIPVTIAKDLRDATALLIAERDENTCRQNMIPTELAALGLALEELERPRAHARIRAAQNNPSSENFTEQASGPTGNTRDIVASALGVSGPTYDRAKAVLLASEDETLPDEVRTEVQEIKDEMDRTGKVAPAYNKMLDATGRRRGAEKKSGRTEPRTASPRRIGPGAARRRMEDFERAVIAVVGTCTATELVAIPEGISAERRDEMIADLKRAAQAVHHFRRRLEETES